MSLRKAINEKCKSCIYDRHQPGTWRQQTEACEIRSCPLWGVRPKSASGVNSGADLSPKDAA